MGKSWIGPGFGAFGSDTDLAYSSMVAPTVGLTAFSQVIGKRMGVDDFFSESRVQQPHQLRLANLSLFSSSNTFNMSAKNLSQLRYSLQELQKGRRLCSRTLRFSRSLAKNSGVFFMPQAVFEAASTTPDKGLRIKPPMPFAAPRKKVQQLQIYKLQDGKLEKKKEQKEKKNRKKRRG